MAGPPCGEAGTVCSRSSTLLGLHNSMSLIRSFSDTKYVVRLCGVAWKTHAVEVALLCSCAHSRGHLGLRLGNEAIMSQYREEKITALNAPCSRRANSRTALHTRVCEATSSKGDFLGSLSMRY